MIRHTGGCHCGRVRFEVLAPPDIEVCECNCSICGKAGYLHLIVPAERFTLLSGMEVLTTYTFNTGAAKHRFCSVCGIKSICTKLGRSLLPMQTVDATEQICESTATLTDRLEGLCSLRTVHYRPGIVGFNARGGRSHWHPA